MLYPTDRDAPSRTRTFQCKAGLWETFEAIAKETGTPLDELIEDAMTAYARSRGHLDAPTDPRRPPAQVEDTISAAGSVRGLAAAKEPPTELDDSDSLPAMRGRAQRSSLRKSTPPPGTMRMPNRPGHPLEPVPAPRGPAIAPGATPTAQPFAPAHPRGITAPPMRSGAATGGAPRSMPPLPAAPMTTLKSSKGAAATLTLTYQGRPYVVDKERFMIGRSKTAADLRVDDANVSRQHAMIERVNGGWYVVDLGSTNGIFVSGERVARRPLRDGDLIEITTHQIRVTMT